MKFIDGVDFFKFFKTLNERFLKFKMKDFKTVVLTVFKSFTHKK